MSHEKQAKELLSALMTRNPSQHEVALVVTCFQSIEQAQAERIAELERMNARLREALEFIATKCSLASDPVAWPIAWDVIARTRQVSAETAVGGQVTEGSLHRRAPTADFVAELEIAKSEIHQVVKALQPWVSGNPDRAHLDLAHFSACLFRAWGAVAKVIRGIAEPTVQEKK